MKKTLVILSSVMLISAVTAMACGDKTKSASVDKAAAGEYACGSMDKAEKAAVKSADADVKATVQTAAAKTGAADCPYMKTTESGSVECTATKDASLKTAAASATDCATKCAATKGAAVKEAAVEKVGSECSGATERVKSASEETKEAVKIDKTVMTEAKDKAEKL